MIKKLKTHSIYEVWNDNLNDSAFFIGHEPTTEDLVDICINERWIDKNKNSLDDIIGYIKLHVCVDEFKKIYTDDNDKISDCLCTQ